MKYLRKSWVTSGRAALASLCSTFFSVASKDCAAIADPCCCQSLPLMQAQDWPCAPCLFPWMRFRIQELVWQRQLQNRLPLCTDLTSAASRPAFQNPNGKNMKEPNNGTEAGVRTWITSSTLCSTLDKFRGVVFPQTFRLEPLTARLRARVLNQVPIQATEKFARMSRPFSKVGSGNGPEASRRALRAIYELRDGRSPARLMDCAALDAMSGYVKISVCALMLAPNWRTWQTSCCSHTETTVHMQQL